MRTSDSCLIIVIVFFGLLTWSILQDEKRQRDRRQVGALAPGGLERRKPRDRRSHLPFGYLAWGLRSQWSKMMKWF